MTIALPRYRDPFDSSRAWSGQRKPPPWIELDPATGKPLSKFNTHEDAV